MTTTTQPPRVGVIGCGAIAESFYLPYLVQDAAVRDQLVLIDPNAERLQALSAKFNTQHSATDYNTVLDQLDSVIVAAPPHLHYRITLDCLRAGLHVLCEKPLALDSREARAMVEQAAAVDRHLMVNFNRRMVATLMQVRQMIQDETLGKPLHIDYYIHEIFNWPTVSGFYFDSRLNTKGVLFDRGAHILDTLYWWLGAKPQITAAQTDSFGGPEAVVTVQFQHAQCSGQMKISILGKGPTGYTITFERGKLVAEEYDYTSFLVTDANGQTRRVPVKANSKALLDIGQDIINNLLDVTRGTAQPLVSGADVLPSAELIDEAYALAEAYERPWYDDPNLQYIMMEEATQ